jgi:hypothetical protein
MQTLAFLWFELQVAQQRLRATFAQSQVPAKARNWNPPSRVGRAAAHPFKPVPRIESAQEAPQLKKGIRCSPTAP